MRHIPVRNCAACRVKLSKWELIRIARSPEGRAFLDVNGKAGGRGFYWCGKKECLEKIRKKGLVGRLLRAKEADDLFSQMEGVMLGK